MGEAATKTTRSVPRLHRIVAHWQEHEDLATLLPHVASKTERIGWDEPFCFACGWVAPIPRGGAMPGWDWPNLGGWLERGHLVDHWLGGSGEASNLVPICTLCHHDMADPYSDRDAALAWLREKRSALPYPVLWQEWTERLRGHKASPTKSSALRARGDYAVFMLRLGPAWLAEFAPDEDERQARILKWGWAPPRPAS